MAILTNNQITSVESAVQQALGTQSPAQGDATGDSGLQLTSVAQKIMSHSTNLDILRNSPTTADVLAGAPSRENPAAGGASVDDTFSGGSVLMADASVDWEYELDALHDLLDGIGNPNIQIIEVGTPGVSPPIPGSDSVIADALSAAVGDHLIDLHRPPQAPQTLTQTELNGEPGSLGVTVIENGNQTTVVDNLNGTTTSTEVFQSGPSVAVVQTVSTPDSPGVAASPTSNTTTVTTPQGVIAEANSVTTPTGMTIWEDELPAASTGGGNSSTQDEQATQTETSTTTSTQDDGTTVQTQSRPDVPTSASTPTSNTQTETKPDGTTTTTQSVTTPTGLTIDSPTNPVSNNNSNTHTNDSNSNSTDDSDSDSGSGSNGSAGTGNTTGPR